MLAYSTLPSTKHEHESMKEWLKKYLFHEDQNYLTTCTKRNLQNCRPDMVICRYRLKGEDALKL